MEGYGSARNHDKEERERELMKEASKEGKSLRKEIITSKGHWIEALEGFEIDKLTNEEKAVKIIEVINESFEPVCKVCGNKFEDHGLGGSYCSIQCFDKDCL